MAVQLETDALKRTLREVLDRADEADISAGQAWYGSAQRDAAELGSAHGVDATVAAGVLSALSPRTQWGRNRRLAVLAFQSSERPSGVFRTSWDKAQRIVAGEAPLDVLGGPKTRAFWANISGDLSAVTVDVWALRALGLAGDLKLTPKLYAQLAAVYAEVAAEYGMAPAAAQATAWVVVRTKGNGSALSTAGISELA